MIKMVLATGNRNKVKEIETILRQYSSKIQVVSLYDIGFLGEIEENGKTIAENSKIKAEVPAKLGYIGVADDSGLEVDALGGAPGVYSARYSGEDANSERNNMKLLAELENVDDPHRTARFRTVVTCCFPDGRYFQAEGVCEGRILKSPCGDGGFGYDPLFYFEALGKTFASMTMEEKNSVSHRGQAVRAFAEKFIKEYKD